VAVHAGGHQVRARGGRRSERICKDRLRLRIERIDRNGALAEPFHDDRPPVHGQHDARPEVDDEEACRDHDRTEQKQVLVAHHRLGLASTTGGTAYSPWRMAAPGKYTRSHRAYLAARAGSQVELWPVGA